jgi:hypothetical protein
MSFPAAASRQTGALQGSRAASHPMGTRSLRFDAEKRAAKLQSFPIEDKRFLRKLFKIPSTINI